MPSIVYQSPGTASRRLSLVSQSVTEQINGLVNVSVQFITTAANRDKVAQLFFLDAPPPIWPHIVNQFELQSQALFMVTRSINQANGLVTIDAEYAGGLRRGGSQPVLITTERDGPNTIFSESDPETLQITRFSQEFNADFPDLTFITTQTQTYTPSRFIKFISIVYQYEFVAIDGVSPALPEVGPLFSILAASISKIVTSFVDGRQVFVNQSFNTDTPETFPNSPFKLPFFENELNQRALTIEEVPNFITPKVKVMRVRKFIS